MGSEPDHPGWAQASNGAIPIELGRFFCWRVPFEQGSAGQYC